MAEAIDALRSLGGRAASDECSHRSESTQSSGSAAPGGQAGGPEPDDGSKVRLDAHNQVCTILAPFFGSKHSLKR